MYAFKLQIGCLLVVMYFVFAYTRATTNRKLPCNRYFDMLLAVAPWAIIFDGVTAWTVNRRDVIPDSINLLLHLLFFVFMYLVLVAMYVYMLDVTIGISRRKRMLFLWMFPSMVTLMILFLFMKDLYYIEGKTTSYSMGISVIACYASLLVHEIIILLLVLTHKRTIEKRKRLRIEGFLSVILLILVIQAVLPEALISSLFPMMAVIAIYVCFEDPYIRQLKHYNDETVTAFATLVENRDDSTGGHIKRTKGYVSILLGEMRKNPAYRMVLTEDYIQDVIKAAPMHDIGKIATPDSILQKPGKLTDEEFAIMKEHAPRGGEIIKETFAGLDDKEYQKIAYEVARFHHEKWNGRGYPEGLKGEEIPLHARVMAIADVFDAVSAKRCYRDAMPIDKCFKIIEEGAGEDFDPKLVEIFMQARNKILDYYEAEK